MAAQTHSTLESAMSSSSGVISSRNEAGPGFCSTTTISGAVFFRASVCASSRILTLSTLQPRSLRRFCKESNVFWSPSEPRSYR
jgi:hypothetical protein